jgi:glycosyltransferase involved in cell wall biosynthesis
MPRWLDRGVSMGIGLAKQYVASTRAEQPPEPSCASLELSGVVYTAFVNPFDPRKNWRDLLSAFLFALRDAADATLVVKLVVSPTLAARALQLMHLRCQRIGLRHRCKLVFLTDYLSDPQLLELMRGSTFAISASRAEGAGLPLQDALAAARPLVAPAHSALAEYVDPGLGFVVDSHPEPAPWPHDSRKTLRTTWHRIVWQSLHDQIRASYDVATRDPERYARLAATGRERMRAFAGAENVLGRLRAALDQTADS